MNICIYGASSPDIDNSYFAPVEALGRAMAKRSFGLVFGGGAQGLTTSAEHSITRKTSANFARDGAACRCFLYQMKFMVRPFTNCN